MNILYYKIGNIPIEKYYTTQRKTNLYNYTILHDYKHFYMTTLYYQTVNISTWLYYTTQIQTYLFYYTILWDCIHIHMTITKLNDWKHLHTIILYSKTGKIYIRLYYTANIGWQSDLFCKEVDLAQEWFVTNDSTQSTKPTRCSHGCFTLPWVVDLLFYGLWNTPQKATPKWWQSF